MLINTEGKLHYQEESDVYTHIIRDENNKYVARGANEADARRLVACWNEHDALVHDNARLYQSLQGEMQGRLKAEQERDEALDVLRNLAAWANKYTAGDHIFHLDELNGAVVEAKAILTKHKVNHDQE